MNLKSIKLETENYLKSKGLEPNPNLPLIENINEVSPRNARDVASRMFAMSNLIGMGYGAKRSRLKKDLKTFQLWPFVTEAERKNLNSFRLSEDIKVHYQWLCECCQALAWCLNLVEMDHFKRCDPDLSDKVPPKTDPSSFIEKATLRPMIDIQRQVDLLYRLHWNAKFRDRHMNVKNLNYNVIVERRRAIDWVYGLGKRWDDIALDT
ncbi:DUF4272 domain-containing protein [Litorimonas sp. RW-G-Af-16]|uniref:DUF4272 domain-containing protein n=1 Tax=Litorimonas sp. RW-G-Af-16 TaxID=3241168 RepID=UPI00390CCFA0